MSRRTAVALTLAVVLVQACAFTPAQLDVQANAATRVGGPLAEVTPIRFSPPQLEDARLDKARIGWKKNGYGQNTADITTARPVDQIVEATISKALTDSNHGVGDGGSIEVVGTVDRFWFETDVNFWTLKFIGDVQCTLDFVDAQTKQSIYKSSYAGSYAEAKAGGLEQTWTTVMNKALDKLVEDLVLDDELATALQGRGAAASAPAP